MRLTKNSVGVFQSVIEKVGLTRMLATMALPISRTQQAVVTAFASLVTSDARLSRLLENKVSRKQIEDWWRCETRLDIGGLPDGLVDWSPAAPLLTPEIPVGVCVLLWTSLTRVFL